STEPAALSCSAGATGETPTPLPERGGRSHPAAFATPGFVPHSASFGPVTETMFPLLPSLAAACLYAGATGYQGLRLLQRTRPDRRLLLVIGALALLAHGLSLFTQLLSPSGLHLDFFTASSLIAAAVI